MQPPTEHLYAIFPGLKPRDVAVLDVGANPNGQTPPYQSMLEAGHARITGFEADPAAYAALQDRDSAREQYICAVVGDGSEVEFNHCQSAFMSSIFPPNDELNRHFFWLDENSRVVRKERVQTTRLDDLDEVERIDWFKIDVQGGELQVFQGSERLLAETALVIQTEVLFMPMYVGQPLFSDIDLYLRGLGFSLMRFIDIEERTVRPLVKDQDWEKGVSLMYWADAIYIRDFTKWSELDDAGLATVAAILNDGYGAYDLAHHALELLDERSGAARAPIYRELIRTHGLSREGTDAVSS